MNNRNENVKHKTKHLVLRKAILNPILKASLFFCCCFLFVFFVLFVFFFFVVFFVVVLFVCLFFLVFFLCFFFFFFFFCCCFVCFFLLPLTFVLRGTCPYCSINRVSCKTLSRCLPAGSQFYHNSFLKKKIYSYL